MAANDNRPMSPHLQVYRLPLNAITSITHRLTGVVLAAGAVVLVGMLIAAADGSQTYQLAYAAALSWLGRIVLFAFTLALFYHLLAGVRHLVWDAGYGYDLDTARKGSWTIIVGSVVLTLVTWVLAYASAGG